MYNITVSNRQNQFPVNEALICQAVQKAFEINGITRAELDVAVVDAAEMQRLNVRHLGHDYPADVLSFVLEQNAHFREGQVIVCPAVASDWSKKYGWEPENELVLYAVHGTLHIIGFDDLTPQDEPEMRKAECAVLVHFGLTPPWNIQE